MEEKFQTSFIPKKPIIKERATSSRPVGFLVIISVFILITMIIVTGGLYFYNTVLSKNILKMENDLNLAKNRFEPSKIVQLQVLDKRLNASSEILSKHITISPIFEALQLITMKTIGYNEFSYDFDGTKNEKIKVRLSGVALGYRSIALQSDLFTGNKNFIDPVFSDLLLDDKGNVLFDLDFTLDPSFVDYKRVLQSSEQNLFNTFPNENGEVIN